MLEAFISEVQPREGVGLLDWVVVIGFSVVVVGALVYRLLAKWRDWWSDEN